MIQHHTLLPVDVNATDIGLPLIFAPVPLSPIVLRNFIQNQTAEHDD